MCCSSGPLVGVEGAVQVSQRSFFISPIRRTAMTQDWFTVRDGKETGPFTAQQLKQMAVKQKLGPDDLVRRGDMQAPKKASTIKGLFTEVVPAPAKPPVLTSEGAASPTNAKKVATSNKTLLILSTVGGACLLLCCGTCGFMGFLGNKMNAEFNKELDKADALWDAGKKDEALAVYRAKRESTMLIGNAHAPTVYGRLIDHEYGNGRADAGRKLIDEAERRNITPAVSHPDAKNAMAVLQAEKKEKEQKAEAEKRGEVLTAEFYPFKSGTVQHTMATVYWTKGQTQSKREYTHDGDGVITQRYLKHFMVPGYADVPLPKPSQKFHREKKGFIEIGEKLKFPIKGIDMDWHPIVKIGAVAGEEWERKFEPGMTERYKLVKFSTEVVRNKVLKDGESPNKYLVALIERQTKTTVSDGKVMENIEEIKLGKGIGPVSWRSFRIKDGQRVQNWGEHIAPVVKE